MLRWFRRAKKDENAVPVEAAAAAERPAGDEPAKPAPAAAESPMEDAAIAPAPVMEATPEAAAASESVEIEELAESAEEAPTEPELPKKGFFARLRERLNKTKATLVEAVRSVVRLHGKVDEELLEEIEEILIRSDVGVPTTLKIVDRMRQEARRGGDQSPDAILGLFKESIESILREGNRKLDLDAARPTIVLMVGVNGTGKTTTIGKIAKTLTARGKRVMMVAADTFRAAAADQLEIWARRSESCIVRREAEADPASVVYEALEGARRDEPDVILIDTAGRLHTKVGLMEQLKKLVRVIQKHYPEAPHETILVLDATTGQNAVNQVKIFHEACALTGLIMTKLDGTAKGGILIACKDQFGLPIYKIGIGEGVDDLRDFEPHEFVEALFGSDAADRSNSESD